MTLEPVRAWMLGAVAIVGCASEAGEADSTTTMATTTGVVEPTSTTDGTSLPTTEPTTTLPATSADTSTGSDPSDTDVDPDSSGDPVPGIECDFTESFDAPDGSPWPAVWTNTGGVMVADIVGGRGRLIPSPGPYAVARVYAPLDCTDVELTFSFEMTLPSEQGFGIYVRQNGGYLVDTVPPGEGYSTFVQAFNMPGISVWREDDGVEEILGAVTPGPVDANEEYRARLQVTQLDPSTTRLRARYWPASAAEPQQWQVERTDSTPSLQYAGGGIAVDGYLTPQSPGPMEFFVDDIVVTPATSP
jgi:hypothetical protein